MSWNAVKQKELDRLRRREDEGTLTDEERHTLEQLFFELEQEEWERLQPALERLRAEQMQMRRQKGRLNLQNVILATLVARQENLLARVRTQMAELLGEHEVIKAQYEQIAGQPPPHHSA